MFRFSVESSPNVPHFMCGGHSTPPSWEKEKHFNLTLCHKVRYFKKMLCVSVRAGKKKIIHWIYNKLL